MSDFFSIPFKLPEFGDMGYAHNRLSRDTEHRDEDSLGAMMVQTGARYFLFDDERVVLSIRSDRRNALFCQDRVQELGGDMDKVILLGSDPEERFAPRLALPLKPEAVDAIEASEEYEFWTVRAVGLKRVLPPDQLGAIAQARSLLFWHDNHQYCGKCGSPSHVALAGARRDCPSCGSQYFPRTDPTVIMLAIREDEKGVERCLLGHHTRFQDQKMYSTLAGFMEQGETLEDAVRREIYEEAGVRIGAVRYMASQPWPFPYSLMIGCYAEALNEDITLDETELTDAQWFSREEIHEMMKRGIDSDQPHIPAGFSIAAWLIRGWADRE